MTAKKKEAAPEAVPNPNMELWNRICKTNPANTKRVTTRGGFTAIGAHSQIMTATEAWGPCGGDWGFKFEWLPDPDMWVAMVTLWYPGFKNDDTGEITMACSVAQVGAAARAFGGKPDSDAPKKAITDGLTKCFSYTGMNADVFLGRYDDNKYVAEMRAEFGLNPGAAPMTTGAETLPKKVPHDPRATGRDRMQYLCNRLCGDKDSFEYFTGLAADLGMPMLPDDMNDDQFRTILAELEAMEADRAGAVQPGLPGQLPISSMGDEPPMSAYDDEPGR